MTASIPVRKKEHEKVIPHHLIPVIYKKKRATSEGELGPQLNFHTFKCFGAVLNPFAVHGRGQHIRRLVGQDQKAVMSQLSDIAAGLQEAINDR